MARYHVSVQLRQGWHCDRTVRARSAEAAYEKVCRELVESSVDTSRGGEVTVERKRRGPRKVTLLRPRGDGGDSGLAGVREPRRPQPGPPSLTMALDLPRDS